MARRSNLPEEIEASMADKDSDEPRLSLVTGDGEEKKPPVPQRRAKREVERQQRRIEAMSLKVAGLTYEQIGERLGISGTAARELVARNLERADNRMAEEMRSIENARLDRAQAAIWTRVLEGDLKAIDAYLRISSRRARLNGLDAPQQVDLSLSIRQEMEQALVSLEQMVLGEVVTGEVVSGDSDEG